MEDGGYQNSKRKRLLLYLILLLLAFMIFAGGVWVGSRMLILQTAEDTDKASGTASADDENTASGGSGNNSAEVSSAGAESGGTVVSSDGAVNGSTLDSSGNIENNSTLAASAGAESDGAAVSSDGTGDAGSSSGIADGENASVSENEDGNEYAASVQGAAETEDTSVKTMVLDVSGVVAEAMPAVVSITNKSVQEVQYMFQGTAQIESESSGSGIILAQTSDEILIATSYHVIENATTLTVCFSTDVEDEEENIVTAVEKGSEPDYDLAVIAVSISDVPEAVLEKISVAQLGSSGDLQVGEPAIAIGNALGYGQSVTLGIISALDRALEIDGVANNYIQTDAAINFGNSGGMLLNVNGEVIGINSAKAASSGVEGMSYAIPIDEAQPILSKLSSRETRTAVSEEEQGYLGVYTQDISSEARNLYSIPNGVYVYLVESGSPAETAGIQRGDIISQFDGNTVTDTERLDALMTLYRSGETVTLVILRADYGSYVEQELTVTLSEKPQADNSYNTPWSFGRR